VSETAAADSARPRGQRPNWFIALPVDASPWFRDRVTTPPAGVRRFHADDLHLTVAFLGACGDEAARRAFARVSEWSLEPLEASVGDLVPMGTPQRYSALALLLEQGREPVEREIGRVRDGWLAAADARPDTRAPKAHVTIARPRRRGLADERRAGLEWAEAIDLHGLPVSLGRPALYTWSPERKERLFEIVERS